MEGHWPGASEMPWQLTEGIPNWVSLALCLRLGFCLSRGGRNREIEAKDNPSFLERSPWTEVHLLKVTVPFKGSWFLQLPPVAGSVLQACIPVHVSFLVAFHGLPASGYQDLSCEIKTPPIKLNSNAVGTLMDAFWKIPSICLNEYFVTLIWCFFLRNFMWSSDGVQMMKKGKGFESAPFS